MKTDGKERMEQMREEYNRIPVPEPAKMRIESGIRRAEREKRRNAMIRFGKTTGITVAAAMAALTIAVNVSPAVANAMENVPVLGRLVQVVTLRTYEKEDGGHEAKIEVPKVSIEQADDSEVNRTIEEYADGLIKQYEKELNENSGEGHYSVTSGYDVVTDNEKYLCLRITTTEVKASGAESVKIFTVDKASGKVLSLEDLFKDKEDYVKALSDNIKKQMEEQMAEDESKMYFYHSGEEAAEDFAQITGKESYYFNQDGELVIVFDEYEVAPGYMGVVEFTIPKEVTGELS